MTTEQETVPEPPALLALLQDSMRAPLTPATVFSAYRDLPAPGFGAMAGNLLLWAAAAGLLNLIMVYMELPATAALGLVPGALALLGFLAAALLGSFFAGGALFAIGALCGGRSSFERSYLILSLLSPLLLAASAVLWAPTPFLSLALTVFAAWLLARGIGELCEAPGTQTAVVVGILAVLALSVQILARPAFQRAQRQLEVTANLYSTAAGLAGALPPAAGELPPEPPQTAQDPGVQPVPEIAGAVAPDSSLTPLSGGSSVDMVQGMGNPGSQGLPLVQPGRAPTLQDMQQMQQVGMNALDNVSKQLNDPKTLRNMSPDQAAQMRQLTQFIDQVRTQMNDPKGMSPADRERMTQQAMQLMGTTMQQQQGRRRKLSPPPQVPAPDAGGQ